jgi:starch-binding outer membrane protein, SusD/RagB family
MEKTSMGQLRIIAAVVAAAALTGCGSWFEPQKDDVIDPSQLNSPAALATLRDGARSDFAAAFAGNYDVAQEGIVLTSGLIADEFDNADTYPTRTEMDRRTMNVLGQNSSLLDVYRLMHRARVSLDNVASRTRALAPDNKDAIAELQALSGVMHLSFAENFCSGVPLSSVDSTGQLVYGPQKTTTELYDIAEAKFDSAASLGADQAYTNLAQLGKARVLLDRGQLAAAAAAASAVPTDFRYATTHSGTNNRTTNAIYAFHYLGFRWSVGIGDGAGSPFVVDFGKASDPRLPIDPDPSLERFDGEGTLYAPLMFSSRSSPTPIATGIEARLIEAEAQLAANDGTWLTTLNNLRSAVPGLTPLSDPGTRDSRLQLLFKERGFWLFGQALRLSDMRRLIRQYGFTQDQVLPTGPYLKGGDYGTDVNIPIPFGERNNPSVTVGAAGVCLDRNP